MTAAAPASASSTSPLPDGVAEEAQAPDASSPEAFISRRRELGQPRSIVSEAPAELAERPVTATGRAGAWYKLGAGLLFLISLGYIGYRQQRSRRLPPTDWEALEQPLSRWRHPDERSGVRSADRRGAEARSGDGRADETRVVEGVRRGHAFPAGEEDADMIVRDLRPSSSNRRAGGGRFDAYDEEPLGDPGFHPEIEKRVRRKQLDAAPGSRFARGAGYAAIGEMNARGYEPEQIARHLGLTPAEVRTYLQIERRPMLD